MDGRVAPLGILVLYLVPNVVFDGVLEIATGSPLSFSDPLGIGGIGE